MMARLLWTARLVLGDKPAVFTEVRGVCVCVCVLPGKVTGGGRSVPRHHRGLGATESLS